MKDNLLCFDYFLRLVYCLMMMKGCLFCVLSTNSFGIAWSKMLQYPSIRGYCLLVLALCHHGCSIFLLSVRFCSAVTDDILLFHDWFWHLFLMLSNEVLCVMIDGCLVVRTEWKMFCYIFYARSMKRESLQLSVWQSTVFSEYNIIKFYAMYSKENFPSILWSTSKEDCMCKPS